MQVQTAVSAPPQPTNRTTLNGRAKLPTGDTSRGQLSEGGDVSEGAERGGQHAKSVRWARRRRWLCLVRAEGGSMWGSRTEHVGE